MTSRCINTCNAIYEGSLYTEVFNIVAHGDGINKVSMGKRNSFWLLDCLVDIRRELLLEMS